ncbi:hypothetical protein [Dongia sedimenti]|uniref:Uncharacterized protein n=1 Tax=Dongia sedimenti TaxID=3064282 RepID=A0ABU0YMC9_9PROT|nr:hypothetical protein [Rhodospirillaceae bacterium R-7]
MKVLKWLVATCGVLLVGAISSGLWEVMLKPILAIVTPIAIHITTLGMTSLDNNIYKDIAQGTHSRADSLLLGLFLGLIVGVVGGIVITISKRKDPDAEAKNRRTRRQVLAGTMVLLFSVTLLTLISFRTVYVQQAAVYLAQLNRIVAPYIAPQEALAFQSRAALVETRASYVALEAELKAIAEKNGVAAPEFFVY